MPCLCLLWRAAAARACDVPLSAARAATERLSAHGALSAALVCLEEDLRVEWVVDAEPKLHELVEERRSQPHPRQAEHLRAIRLSPQSSALCSTAALRTASRLRPTCCLGSQPTVRAQCRAAVGNSKPNGLAKTVGRCCLSEASCGSDSIYTFGTGPLRESPPTLPLSGGRTRRTTRKRGSGGVPARTRKWPSE